MKQQLSPTNDSSSPSSKVAKLDNSTEVTETRSMLLDPGKKYKRPEKLTLADREWPNKVQERAPRWMSTDLRDGNQSLVNPMSVDEKMEYYDMLYEIGFREIEIGFPSASQVDFDFVQNVIKQRPDTISNVALQVLSPCRPDLILRTIESLRGAKHAILHIYHATSPDFRSIVFGKTQKEILQTVVECVKYVRANTKDSQDPEISKINWQFEFSPEAFSDTELSFSLEVCNAVINAWDPSPDVPIILNLPATIESNTPNVYADKIEFFSRNVSYRESVCISIHTHNDRGCAVAATELGLLAGGQRVEGCLFGNGERTGNVDLITVALNLYAHGISPGLDFSNLETIKQKCARLNKIPIGMRHPYVGDLVHCAFSGSHQDAIKKGFAFMKKKRATTDIATPVLWQVPYLPIDPQDFNFTYEAVIRVNSQSGKGGVAWVIGQQLKLDLPRAMQVAFSREIQKLTESFGRELKPVEIVNEFNSIYKLDKSKRLYALHDYSVRKSADRRFFEGEIARLSDGKSFNLHGVGNGPLSSFCNALKGVFDQEFDVSEYHEHAISEGRDAVAACYVLVTRFSDNSKKSVWGVGIDEDVTSAGLQAILSAAEQMSI